MAIVPIPFFGRKGKMANCVPFLSLFPMSRDITVPGPFPLLSEDG